MTTFEVIASTLTGRPAWPFSRPADREIQTNKTECMRTYLREHGAANAATLADEANLPQATLVGALLKVDLARGRVFRRDGKYHWNPQFDADLQKRLSEAAKLLRANGYTVKRGSA